MTDGVNYPARVNFADTLVCIQAYVRCSKCGAFLRIDRHSVPYIYVETEHKCNLPEKLTAKRRVTGGKFL